MPSENISPKKSGALPRTQHQTPAQPLLRPRAPPPPCTVPKGQTLHPPPAVEGPPSSKKPGFTQLDWRMRRNGGLTGDRARVSPGPGVCEEWLRVALDEHPASRDGVRD